MTAKKRAQVSIYGGLAVGGVLFLISTCASLTQGNGYGFLYGLLCLVMAPIYAFGFAFADWKKIMRKTARNTKAAVSGFFFARILDRFFKDTKYTMKAWIFGLILVAWNIGMGWIPGIFRGIKMVNEEKKQKQVAKPVKQPKEKKPSRTAIMPKTTAPKAAPIKPEPVVTEPAPFIPVAPTAPKAPVTPVVPRTPKAPAKPTLLCTSGIFAGAKFDPAAGEELIIGSDPNTCNIVLPKSIASPLHCTMYYDAANGSWKVRNLTDGQTMINGIPDFKPGIFSDVKHGSVITIGSGKDAQTFTLA